MPTEARPWPEADTGRALVNGFGITGTIVSVVVEQAPPPRPRAVTPAEGGVLTLSARSAKSLTALVHRYREFLDDNPAVDVADLCRVSNTGRAHFRHRAAGVVRDRADLNRVVDRWAAAGPGGRSGGASKRPPKVAFLFSGAQMAPVELSGGGARELVHHAHLVDDHVSRQRSGA